jgi:hypothetical protein
MINITTYCTKLIPEGSFVTTKVVLSNIRHPVEPLSYCALRSESGCEGIQVSWQTQIIDFARDMNALVLITKWVVAKGECPNCKIKKRLNSVA